jgi:hypothetical protein
MDKLLEQLQATYPSLSFTPNSAFYWSPKDKTVYYVPAPNDDEEAIWKLFHETAHGVLGHTTYITDFGLLNLEAQAWHTAHAIAEQYGHSISQEHIEDCLDSYRDWLYSRSKCPTCGSTGLQDASRAYQCLNCSGTWQVSRSRFCRAYRRSKQAKT